MPAPAWRLCLETLKRVALPRGRAETGLFSLEGLRSMERALRGGSPIREVLVSERFTARNDARHRRILDDVAAAGLPLRVAPDAEVDALTQGRGLGDVFALLAFPKPPTLEELFDGPGRRLVVVGWNLNDPGNTGAVIRSALAAGAAGFIAVGTTDPWHPKSVRTSMGSLFRLPVRHEEDLGWMDALPALGVETLASVCRDAEPLPDFVPRQKRLALFMGSEAFGLTDEVVARLDRRITIPMPDQVDSYSINAATAVLAYTLMRLPV
jgi:RNA methyltransferase, TrmH family